MIKSMTAYAKSEETAAMLNVAVEIRSYNSRYLDIALKLTHGYGPLEEKIKKLIAQYINRGRLEVNITVKDTSESEAIYEVDLSRAKAYHRALLTLKKAFYIEEPLNLGHLLNSVGLLRSTESEKDQLKVQSEKRKA